MFSPALRHRQKVLAAQASRAAAQPGSRAKRTLAQANASTALTPSSPAADTKAGSEYAALLAVLHENLRSLSDIQSHEARQPKKAEYARQFDDWVKGVVDADEPVQDEIVVTMMIWAVDCRDWAKALAIAGFVIGHGLALPERYQRTASCFLAEDVADLALAQHEDVPQEVLFQVQVLTAGHDMPDQVNAKLLKAIGRSWKRKADEFDPTAENAVAGGGHSAVAAAIEAFERALKFDPQVGVKKDIQQAKALQKKLAAASQS